MSYDTPAPEVETTSGSKDTDSQPTSPTKPDDVDPQNGTDEEGKPVDNPAG